MRAWVLHSPGDIRLEAADIPTAGSSEMLIRVRAVGVCGSDIPRIYETGAHTMPLIPGHELSGVVEEVGAGTDSYWVGKRVGVYPLIPCGKCRPCMTGHPEMCRAYDYIGSRRDGAFAEYVTAPAANLIELPEGVSFEEGAMLEPMAVAAHAMRLAADGYSGLPAFEAKIVVCGLGAIGLLLTMLLREVGYKNIYVIANRDGQKKRAAAYGVAEDFFCDSGKENAVEWIRERTGGADIYFECVGKRECVLYGIEAAAPGGRIVLVGNPASDMWLSRETYWKLLRNQLVLCGSWNSSFFGKARADAPADDWDYVLERLRERRIDPAALITHRYPMEGLGAGLRLMREKTEDYCKVMMTLTVKNGN